MFAAIQNQKITYCVENETLCEALARGFQSIDELRAWQDELPRDGFGCAVIPEAPFEIRRLEGRPLEEYLALERAGYRPGEIRIVESEEPSEDREAEAEKDAPLSTSAAIANSEDSAQSRWFAPDRAALERREIRAAWDAVREKRNALLDKSDKYMMPDYPINDSKRAQWRDYRAELRDVTKIFATPEAVEWPPPPE